VIFVQPTPLDNIIDIFSATKYDSSKDQKERERLEEFVKNLTKSARSLVICELPTGKQLTSGLHSKPQKMTGCRTLATWQRAPSYNALHWAVDCALSSSLLPSENLVMASVPESSQPDSDAEEDHLISHEYEDAKDRRIDELHYSRRRTWIPATTSSLVTLVVVTALLSMLLSGFALYFLRLLGPQQPSRIAHPQPGTRFGFCGDTPAPVKQIAHSTSCHSHGSHPLALKRNLRQSF